ncbi:hypothetical protein D6C77_10530 [Aureobasidium pullulans]|nr:hypothetical protein D6C77_10530 [Aureobasidium pullulans]
MTTIMEVNMPGCRWLTVHGYGEQSAFYAVAAGLASGPDIPRPLDWSEGTPEREIFDFILRTWDSGSGSFLAKVWGVCRDTVLVSVIMSWNHLRQGGQYGLIVNDKLRIGRNSSGMLAGGTKPADGTVVVRQVGRRWEVLAHFTDPKPTKIIFDELQKHSSIMLRTVEKLKEDLEKVPSPAPDSLTATMEVLLAALKLAAVAEDKETTA